jgi:hypothetical protein
LTKLEATAAEGVSRDAAPGSKVLPLFASVRLVRTVRADGDAMPTGAMGTIVERLGGGEAYIVEFFEPRHSVMTVHSQALSAEQP